ncbi:MAG TPA: hypothetical protein VGR26_11790 [Acidimicrobiales bacterium]|nr:hypothetical protein [Acidimicrobiales bacterium]
MSVRSLTTVVVLATLLAGCGGDEETSTASDSTTTTSTIAPESSETAAASPAPEVEGEKLPDELLGSFHETDGDRFFIYYEAGDEFCTETVGTEQNCYAAGVAEGTSTTPVVEFGVAAVDGDVIRYLTLEDPGAECIGTTNEVRWSLSGDELTLTAIEDCHGGEGEPIALTRVE